MSMFHPADGLRSGRRATKNVNGRRISILHGCSRCLMRALALDATSRVFPLNGLRTAYPTLVFHPTSFSLFLSLSPFFSFLRICECRDAATLFNSRWWRQTNALFRGQEPIRDYQTGLP